MKPLVSIIMPAYNVEKYIAEAIGSIINQTYSKWELLICDDGSNDATLEIANSFSDIRITVFANKDNVGNLKTTNFLFGKCNGEFITIQDADDWSASNRLEKQLGYFLQDAKIGMVGTNYLLVDENRNPIACGLIPETDSNIKAVMKKEVIPLLYATVMIKKKIIDQVGFFRIFFNRRGYADFDWLARCSELCDVFSTKEILYFYRKHTLSFSHNYPKDLFNQYMPNLIVEAHKARLSGDKDYFELPNIPAIKKQISTFTHDLALTNFWNGHFTAARKYFVTAIKLNPFNMKLLRDFFFFLRTKNTNEHSKIK